MRYAVISDIHANLQAWNAVLTDIATRRADRIICLGDCIGYGPNPSEVLESLYRHVDAFCMGNHDAAVCGKLDRDLFHDHARRALDWTCGQLSEKAARFLAAQPLLLTGPGFRCAHGDFTSPAAFNYIEDSTSAAPSWAAAPEPLLFVGHTHVPALFVIGASGTTHHLQPQSFVLESGKRYLVNPGSVGSPRSGDALASYCLYDDANRTVDWISVPFDLDACRDALVSAGFAVEDSPFLSHDPRQRLTAIREAVSFSPAKRADQLARGVVLQNEVTRLSRRTRLWKRIALVAAGSGLCVALAAIGFVLLRPPSEIEPLVLPTTELPHIDPPAHDNILPPFPFSTDGASLAGWRVRLDRPLATILVPDPQGIAVTTTGKSAHFRITSPPIRINRNSVRQARLTATWIKAPDFKGTILFAIEQLGPPEAGVYPVLVRETKDPPPTKTSLRHTTQKGISPATHFIRLAIEGDYSGTAVFDSPTLMLIAP